MAELSTLPKKRDARAERRMVRHAEAEELRRMYRQARTKGCTRVLAFGYGYFASRTLGWPWDRLR